MAKCFDLKQCKRCGDSFTPTGACAFFCPPCGVERVKENGRSGSLKYRMKLGIGQVGVGKGMANARGKDDGQFKTGISYFRRRRTEIREGRRYCQRCDKDLLRAKRAQWCVHHRDRNRRNNEDWNLELLCKRCHQLEHNCVLAFRKCNDYPKTGVGNSVPEAQSAPMGAVI